jgi:hypothetical protein
MAWTISLTTKRRIIIACALCLILFSVATILHFVNGGSLVGLLVSVLALIPLSFIIRFTTAEILLKLQSCYRSGLLKDLVTPVFG